jgi:hypothetical protein
MMTQLVQTMRGQNHGTSASSGQASTFSTASSRSNAVGLSGNHGDRHGRTIAAAERLVL